MIVFESKDGRDGFFVNRDGAIVARGIRSVCAEFDEVDKVYEIHVFSYRTQYVTGHWTEVYTSRSFRYLSQATRDADIQQIFVSLSSPGKAYAVDLRDDLPLVREVTYYS